MPYSGRDIALFVIAFFFPPIAVLIKRGCGIDFLINICLWALGAGKWFHLDPFYNAHPFSHATPIASSRHHSRLLHCPQVQRELWRHWTWRSRVSACTIRGAKPCWIWFHQCSRYVLYPTVLGTLLIVYYPPFTNNMHFLCLLLE